MNAAQTNKPGVTEKLWRQRVQAESLKVDWPMMIEKPTALRQRWQWLLRH